VKTPRTMQGQDAPPTSGNENIDHVRYLVLIVTAD